MAIEGAAARPAVSASVGRSARRDLLALLNRWGWVKVLLFLARRETRWTWWNCDCRAISVVTIDVPTPLPMLRMKLTSPATVLFFSAGTPMYTAVVVGMKMKGIGTNCKTRSQVTD